MKNSYTATTPMIRTDTNAAEAPGEIRGGVAAPHDPHAASAPLVSIVILSFNSRDLLPRAVESVEAQTHANIELIIVDNASTDGTGELLDDYARSAIVIRERENTGFARGMNRGYAASRGEFFIPLNTDAVLHPEFVARAVRLFDTHARLGVVAPEVVKIDQTGDWRFWQSSGDHQSEGGVVSLTRLMRVRVLEDAREDWRPSFKANGACPVIRRALVEAMREKFGVAPFDPVFDTYGEDVDFAFKAWSLRWQTMYAREVRAGHVRSYASAVELPDKRGRLRINLIAERYINAARHTPLTKLIPATLAGLAEDARMIVRQLRKGDREILLDARTAFGRVLRLLPALLRFRRTHRTWRKIDFGREVYNRFTPADSEHKAHARAARMTNRPTI